MTHTKLSALDRSIEKTNIWINELEQELGTDDRKYAYRLLRAYLHALRDRITVDEAAQLGAQLPDLIRGIYYEGWNPSETPRTYRHFSSFLNQIAEEAALHGETEASVGASATTRVLRRHVSAGELDDIFAILPQDVRQGLDKD